MKAAVYYENGDPRVLKYEDVPDPVCHRKGVVVKVAAVSVEGGDISIGSAARWSTIRMSWAIRRRARSSK
jgi:NADPH:quinone reductase-like Zn-dependent oxidoreductase